MLFVLILTSLVSLTLAGMYSGLKPIHEENEALYSKRATLSAIQSHLDSPLSELSPEKVLDIFSNSIEQKVLNMKGEELDVAAVEALGYKGGKAENIDMAKEVKKPREEQILPLYIYKNKEGKNVYILTVRGKGLWDEIWGCIALDPDLKTISGVAFDHKGETPGLGAEIKDNGSWVSQFTGKQIYVDGTFTSVKVRKGGAKNDLNEVDGISGATITADGVSEMLKRGLAYYEPYLKSLKS
jgi:Na+-transporting NADH:ubiquinone oxidoreductase subunit C